ncbi:MAG TPA: hypothetical protein VM186_11675 [Planctomycetota bacterium]|nr:hypothetical protein [Planctomycetota bacterium]
MFTDYVTFLLTKMVCGLFVLAHFSVYGLDAPQGQPLRWWAAFGITGYMALWGHMASFGNWKPATMQTHQ